MLVWEKYNIDEFTLQKIEGAIISAPSLKSERYWKKVKEFVLGVKEKEYNLEFTIKQRNWMFSILADLGKAENERARNRNL